VKEPARHRGSKQMKNGEPNWNSRKKSLSLSENRRNENRSFARRDKRKRLIKHRRLYESGTVRRGSPPKTFNRPYQKLRTKFPEALDFVGNTKQTLEFFNAFKQKTLFDPADEMFVDLSQLKNISPDAALVLIAGMSGPMLSRSVLQK